uniref:Family with sequence similarity 13 member A n=1 Tax=Pavo cristatus TaxID=9049 RepID=A0A8C9L7X6_PAVCR
MELQKLPCCGLCGSSLSAREHDSNLTPEYSESSCGSLSQIQKTIRSAVEQHLFDVHGSGGQSSEDSESGTSSASSNVSARQRRRQHKEQEEARRNRDMICNVTRWDCRINTARKSIHHKNTYMQSQALETVISTGCPLSMKIQEHPSIPENKLQRNQDADDQENSFVSEVPRLDLTTLCDDNNWEEPIPALSSWQRDGLDSEEARLSPQAGRLIRQLLDEDSDPMLSPRFYAYGQSQQYLDDTEVPPSPPNSHSFMRRRSSSLGSYEDDREDLTPAQLTRRIQGLKKKIRKFEDKFEEERKYRPSHSDKAANPEVLKWTNDLAKFRKQLKESKLKISEEDLGPVVRQRSNTLPKSFGSQLEKEDDKKQDLSDKSAKPAVEVTLDSIQKKLQEKRTETNRPEDIKDMTRDQIAAEKVALQKALLYYESIHGRPVCTAAFVQNTSLCVFVCCKSLFTRDPVCTGIAVHGPPSCQKFVSLLVLMTNWKTGVQAVQAVSFCQYHTTCKEAPVSLYLHNPFVPEDSRNGLSLLNAMTEVEKRFPSSPRQTFVSTRKGQARDFLYV